MLTDALIEQYRTDGYVLVADLLDSDTLDTLRAVTDEIVSGAAGIDAHTDALDLENSHRPDAPRVRRIKKPHLVHPFYRELAAHPGIMDALTPLIGEDIRLRPAGKVNIKAAGYGSPIEWHQDWAFYPHTNQDVLAVGILLDDMDADNGPIMFLPGSHRGPIYDHHSRGRFLRCDRRVRHRTGRIRCPGNPRPGGYCHDSPRPACAWFGDERVGTPATRIVLRIRGRRRLAPGRDRSTWRSGRIQRPHRAWQADTATPARGRAGAHAFAGGSSPRVHLRESAQP